MIKQKVGGKTVNTVYAEMSAADLATVQALLVGKLEIYDKKFSGGTTSAVPSVMNYIRFSVGKKVSKGVYISGSNSVPHIKQGKSIADARTLVVGAFDASFTSDAKAEYCNLIGSNSEVA